MANTGKGINIEKSRRRARLAGCMGLALATWSAQAATTIDPALAKELLTQAARLSNRELPANLAPPPLIPVTARVINEQICPEAADGCPHIIAAYSVLNRNILYREELDLASPMGRSFLIHEFTHFLQHHEFGDRINASCKMVLSMERQAYSVQRIYLKFQGHPVVMNLPYQLPRCREDPG